MGSTPTPAVLGCGGCAGARADSCHPDAGIHGDRMRALSRVEEEILVIGDAAARLRQVIFGLPLPSQTDGGLHFIKEEL